MKTSSITFSDQACQCRASGAGFRRLLQSLILPLVFGSCSTTGDKSHPVVASWRPGDPKGGLYSIEHVVDHTRDNWNYLGLWRRVGDRPPSFVPADLARSSAIDEAHGSWIVDAEDGWRFFVPNGGTAKYQEDTLLAEAGKVTNRLSKSETIRRDVRESILLTPLAIGLTSLYVMAQSKNGCAY